jgi:spermidine synthase
MKEMMKLRNPGLVPALFLMGFTSVVAQVLLIRELMVAFYGNELSLGIIFFNWLIMVALGSFVFGRLADRLGTSSFVLTQVLVSFILPVQIFLARTMKTYLGIQHGVIIGLAPIFGCSLLVLAPLCILVGFQFVLGSRIYSRRGEAPQQVGRVYVYEALGSMLGGAAFTYLLVGYLHPFEIAALVSVLNLASASSLQIAKGREANRPATYILLLLFVLGISASFHVDGLQDFSSRTQWMGHDLIYYQDSIYGNIAVTRTNSQSNFYSNGLIMFTAPDPDIIGVEEATHFPLLYHPSPRKVLLIGGGAGGVLEEILKHPVDRVHYTELDPLIIEVSKKYLASSSLEDPRVEIKTVDGRFFVKRTSEKYDVVILNLPPPSTLQLNRFYTREFFEEVQSILNSNGIFSLVIPSSEYYMGKEMREHNGCIYSTLGEVFHSLLVVPGERSYFIASQTPLSYDAQMLAERMEERGLETKVINEYYIGYKFSKVPRALEDLRSDVVVNRDLQPIGIYYNIALWNVIFYPEMRTFLDAFLHMNLWWFVVPCVLLILASIRFRPRPERSVTIAIGMAGFAGIIFSILLIFSFQVFYGYVYQSIGLLIAAFHVGVAGGGLYMSRVMGRLKKDVPTFAKILGLICIYSLVLPALLISLFPHPEAPMEAIFLGLNVVAGFLVGASFPLATKISLRGKGVGKAVGNLYASDLFGACAGTILGGIFLIPVLGISSTCVVIAMVNLVALAWLILGPMKTVTLTRARSH